MKALNHLTPVLLAFLVGSTLYLQGCAPPPPAGLSAADEAAITTSSDAWQAAANARDWEALAANYTEDAIFMAPGMPALTGRPAIAEWHTATPEGTDLQLAIVEISGSGDLAYVYGTYTMTVPMGETTMTDAGKYIEIRRKQTDGSWPIIRDIFNSDQPIPEPEM